MPSVPGLLFDEHVNATACRQLKEHGLDVVHVHDAGLDGAPDAEVLDWARARGRIVVTRNYRDFVPLVETLVFRKVAFPGVLLLSTSIRQGDVGAHVRAVQAWREAYEAGDTSVDNGFAWLV